MSKELKFEFNDYIIAIDEPYENDCGYVAIGKKDTKGNINIWFKSLNEQTVDFYIELQKHISDLEAKLAESEKSKQSFKVMYFNKCLDYEHLHEKFDDKCAEFELKEYDYKQTIFEKDQDKISFCVEKLQEVKEQIGNKIDTFIDSYGDRCIETGDLEFFIDNQIAELKKGVE